MILSLIAISVVFGCLLILFIIYSVLGGFFSGKIKLPLRRKATTPAACTNDTEIAAAIALAIKLYTGSTAHDIESGFITIKSDCRSNWNDKSLTFRKSPGK